MPQSKNEIPTLLAALGITAIAVGAIGWFVGRSMVSQWGNTTSSTSPSTANPPTTNNANTSSGANPPLPSVTPEGHLNAVQNVPTGLFNYGGSTTWAPIRKEMDAQIQLVFPDFRLRYTDPVSGTPGSGQGIKMLLEGQLAFAQSSRPIKDEEYQSAQQRGFMLEAIPVAIDGIAVAVNHDLAVEGITIAQLKGIYAGTITNWQQVGGPNQIITPYSRRLEDGGTVEFFQDSVMEGAAFGSNVQYVHSTTPGLRAVAVDPGGIYYASAPEVVPQCIIKTLSLGHSAAELVSPHEVPAVPPEQCPNRRDRLAKEAFSSGDYPITRRLFVIVKKDGQADQRAGQAYATLALTEEGQALMEQAGFVGIR
jgi:phosphate transport system substrate-binding protein